MHFKHLGKIMAILLAATAAAAAADRIILKNGGVIEGEILKNDDTAVVVDIGCDVLRLPKSAVGSIVKSDAPAATRKRSIPPANRRCSS